MEFLNESIALRIWQEKYRYKEDQHIEATWRRVAKAIARAEKPNARTKWENAFFDILHGFKFLPGGRILAGAGTPHHVTLLNCFVMPIAQDSLPGIFRALEEGALTLQQGGGVGYDFSILRPHGDKVIATGIEASGPVSFMRIWDAMCGVLLSTGARRGAMMGVMRCDHPDIEMFIAAKKDARMLRHFNLSVMVTDAFMQAVAADDEWPLVFPAQDRKASDEIIMKQWGDNLVAQPCRVYRRIRARALWEMIIRAAYDYAEPGVLFADTINQKNNLWYSERIAATNPCGEIPLPSYGACDLGAINLTQFVLQPFTKAASINWPLLADTTAVATRFLDNVLDVSNYPLEAQKQQSHLTRRIGLGLTGLADLFVMMGIEYGSHASLQLAKDIMRCISRVTWHTSIELAKEKGPFPGFQPQYLRGEFVQSLEEEMQAAIAINGIRNSHHNTIAPAGTISLLANNVSNGIEPIFRASYQRQMLTPGGNADTMDVYDYAFALWSKQNNVGELPPAWVDVSSLAPEAHLNMQSVMQPFVDNAISKTINIPADFPFSKLAEVYTKAHALGLKGCTVFRPNDVTGSVLQASNELCCPNET